MIQIDDNTILVGTTDLRTEMPKITKNIKIKKIILTKRGKPVAVIEDFEQYKEKEEFIDSFEDLVLGYLAKERDSKSKKSDYLSEEEVNKKLGIK